MAYASASDLKAYLGISSTADDTLIGSILTRAQKVIETECGRVFEASGDTTHTLDAIADVEDKTLYLDGDLCSVTSVTNGDSVAVASTEYIPEPRNVTPYYALTIKGSAGKSWGYTTDPENAITVVGKWAYSTTAPADIVHATIRLGAWMYRQKDSGMDGDRVLSADGVLVMPAAIPNDVQAILKPYRRKEFR